MKAPTTPANRDAVDFELFVYERDRIKLIQWQLL